MANTPSPIPHSDYDPGCYGCLQSRACRTVCSVCGCIWTIDGGGFGNSRDEGCPDCPNGCHDEAFVERYEANLPAVAL